MTRPDAIVQEPTPCWHLRLPNGDEPFLGDWNDNHYADEEEAAKAAKQVAACYIPPRTLVPARLDEPCWTAKAVCGYRYDERGDTGGVEHWPTRAELRDMLLHLDWKPLEGGGMTCGDDQCADCAVLTVVRVRQEIPGQLAWPAPTSAT